MAKVVGTNLKDSWSFRDYQRYLSLWAYGGDDELQIHCDNSTINMGAGNDTLILKGAWNKIWMGAGNDVVNYWAKGAPWPSGTSGQIGNTIDLGAGDDRATISGDKNSVFGVSGHDFVGVMGNASLVDLGDGNDDVIISGNSSTIIGGGGSDHVSILGNFNSFSASGDRDEGVIVSGAGNRIDCYDGGFGTISCSGDGNWIRAQRSNIQLSYLSDQKSASHQTATISGEENVIDWRVTAKGSAQQVQKLQLTGDEVSGAETNNRVYLKVNEGSVASFKVGIGDCVLYLAGLVDSNRNGNIDGGFRINIDISTRHGYLWFKNDLAGITMNQRADNGWAYDFRQGDRIVGTLEVTQADGQWRVYE